MENNSSKEQMDKTWNILKSIKKVQAPDEIYVMINKRLGKHKAVSLNMMRAIAAIFILVVGFEVYMGLEYLTTAESVSQSNIAYQVTDDFLYHE